MHTTLYMRLRSTHLPRTICKSQPPLLYVLEVPLSTNEYSLLADRQAALQRLIDLFENCSSDVDAIVFLFTCHTCTRCKQRMCTTMTRCN